ncbi:hypothetical protein G9A89_023029 [Geosiphon pyriformis]|nr:hypothetical protein G9A89_023029 [Geosiphon pyriformis]
MTGCRAFFENVNLGLGISIQGLVSSTLAELQAIELALKCVLVARSVCLFSNSQTALDACMLEIDLVYSDFHNQCWVECQHIRNVICSKNLRVSWHKVKGHSGVLGNNWANSIANTTTLSEWFLPSHVNEHFLLVDGGIVFGNSRHFVQDIFHAVCWVCWKVGSGFGFLSGDLHLDVDWPSSSKVWHSDLHMATGFTNRHIADHVYDRCYPSVLCLYCGEVDVSNHVFFCVIDDSAHCRVLKFCMSSWKTLSGLTLFSSSVLQLLLICTSDFLEAVSIFHDPKVAGVKIADFVHSLCVTFRNNIWLVCAKHHAYIKRNGLILVNGSISVLVSGLVSRFLDSVVKLLGIAEAFGIHFSFRKSCSFFSGIGNSVSVNIIV